MKSVIHRLTTLAVATTTAALGHLAISPAAMANQFGQQEISSNRAIAVAAPVNNGSAHQLLILEQVSSSRSCWQEQAGNPTIVDPLLLNFDFSGICGRSTDSNGYSVRLGGEDMNWRYSLRVVRQNNDIVLYAAPASDRTLPTLEIGRVGGATDDFAKIRLNPGWRLTKRTYNGSTLGHFYLTNDQTLAQLRASSTIAAAPPSSTGSSTNTPPSTTPSSTGSTTSSSGSSTSGSTSGSVSVPTAGSNRPQLPVPPSTSVPTTSTPSSTTSGTSGTYYRVTVPVNPGEEGKVQAIVPDAFRTTINGQLVMQTGLFRDRIAATSQIQQLSRAGLRPSLGTVTGTVASSGSSPSTSGTSGSTGSTGSTTVPTTSTGSTSSSNVYYRVSVPIQTPSQEAQVRAVEPGAFRTVVNGQPSLQVGLYRDRATAQEMQQRIASATRLQAVISTYSGTVATPAPSTTNPTTRPVPQTGLVVMLDPGHGGGDPGAVGIGSIKEKDINLSIAQRVASRLEQNGIRVIMTRSDDREIDLSPRVQMAERSNVDLFVSIHANAISMSRPDVNGLETYYYSSGLNLARTIHNSILRNTDMRDRGVRRANFYVIKNTSMPAVLVETGFVTGREDAARFNNITARNQIADAIADGILTYSGQTASR